MPPAARMNDQVTAVDTHIVVVPTPDGSKQVPLPHPFAGSLMQSCSTNVKIAGQFAAVVGSVAKNMPTHIPTPPGTSFVTPPTNQGTVSMGSTTVFINGKPAARLGDAVMTCNDPAPAPVGSIITGAPTVMIGG